MSTICRPATADVLLLYPGQSLRDQMALWRGRHPQRRVQVSCERSLPEIRRLLHRAESTIVDATEDPCKATDAFLQSVARLGAGAVTMYTECGCNDLELFVRMRGSLFLLGPLFEEEWEDVIAGLLRARRGLTVAPELPTRNLSPIASHERASQFGQQYSNRVWNIVPRE
jgi:hypothetical protein